MTNVQVSGIDPGQRRLNGPQTTGREYRNLSQPTHTVAHDDDVTVPMRDGVMLLADVDRPAEPGRYPVLVAASPIRGRFKTLVRRRASLKLVPAISSFPVVTSTSLLIVGAPVGLAAPSVSLMARNVVICTISSSGPRSNPGRTAMSA